MADLMGVHHVALTVLDLEASARWYGEVLGCEELFPEARVEHPGVIDIPPDGIGLAPFWERLTMLDEDAERVVREQRLGYVVSVCPDGTPNLSPKGTLAVWDDEHLVFAHLHSAQTVANIEAGDGVVEVNVVDAIRRKGYRFKGSATVHTEGTVYEEGLGFYRERSGLEASRIKAIVLIEVQHVAPLISPAYDDGTDEAEVERRSLDLYGLMRRRP